jgi:hypothetical protein
MTSNAGASMNSARHGRRGWIAAVVVFGLASVAAGARAAPGQSLNLSAGLSTWYDSNLLQYSDAQLDQFDSGLFTNRFSIESKDDVTLAPSMALTWELDQGRGRRHSLRLKGEGEFHDRNATVDFRAASLTWRESFAGERRFTLRGYVLPNDYLRQLHLTGTGFTPGVYPRAQFDLGIAEVAWSQGLRRGLVGGLAYQLERRLYAPNFPERTSTTEQGEASLELNRLPGHGSIELLGAYRKSLADGRALAAGALLSTSDVSYQGWWTSLNGRTELSRGEGWRFGADLAYRLEGRSYDAERPQDTSHFGRHDLKHTIEAGLRAQLPAHWVVRGFDRFETNHASFDVAQVNETGSFRQNLVGLELTWSADFWTRARSSAKAEDPGAS